MMAHNEVAVSLHCFLNNGLSAVETYEDSRDFGIAIAEALAHGVPVVTTRNTPWGALDQTGCGRCIDLDTGSLVAAITELAEGDLAAMGKFGRDWMIQDFSSDVVNRRLLELYWKLIDSR